MALSITIATGKVAFTVSFPVEVLIKSDPKTKARKTPVLIKTYFFFTLKSVNEMSCINFPPEEYNFNYLKN